MKRIAVIPARYNSKRFPGKPLAKILDKPMIQWVYEGIKSAKMIEEIIIATDDPRIKEVGEDLGAITFLSQRTHRTGTERVFEAIEKTETDIVVNVQVDEPLIRGEYIDKLIESMNCSDIDIATLCERVKEEEAKDPNTVKVVCDRCGFALYFSRAIIPYNFSKKSGYYLKHIGVYAFRRASLEKFVSLQPSELEEKEDLEQLRALENGMKIKILEVPFRTIPVDRKEDIKKVEELLLST